MSIPKISFVEEDLIFPLKARRILFLVLQIKRKLISDFYLLLE